VIRVVIIKSGDSIRGLEVSGHARLCEAGTDVLCAAVSVLTENLGASLELLLRVKMDIMAKKGYYKATISKKEIGPDTDLLFASALLGLQSLAKDHPDRIQIEEEANHGA